MRRTAALVLAAGIFGIAPGAISSTRATAQERIASAAGFACAFGQGGVRQVGSSNQIAQRPGQKLDAYMRIPDTQFAPMVSTVVNFTLRTPGDKRGPAPTVWWRMGTGGWRLMTMQWRSNGGTRLHFWQSGDTAVGTIPARGARTLEVSLSFAGGSASGDYQAGYLVGALGCQHGDTMLNSGYSDFFYRPGRR